MPGAKDTTRNRKLECYSAKLQPLTALRLVLQCWKDKLMAFNYLITQLTEKLILIITDLLTDTDHVWIIIMKDM